MAPPRQSEEAVFTLGAGHLIRSWLTTMPGVVIPSANWQTVAPRSTRPGKGWGVVVSRWGSAVVPIRTLGKTPTIPDSVVTFPPVLGPLAPANCIFPFSAKPRDFSQYQGPSWVKMA